MARMPVGEVTLISVRLPSITSMPTKIRPRRLQLRADGGADLALAGGEVGRLRGAAAHHVGADVVRRRHAVDRARRLAVDEDDALVALGDLRQEALDHPRLAEGRGEQVEERAEVRVLRARP